MCFLILKWKIVVSKDGCNNNSHPTCFIEGDLAALHPEVEMISLARTEDGRSELVPVPGTY